MSKLSKAWAEGVLELYGPYCVFCGVRGVELDHVMPKSQGGPYDVGNGLPVCNPFSPTIQGGHHLAKTQGRIQYPFEVLHPTTIEFLAGADWVAWDEDGQPYGRGWRHFAPKLGALQKGGTRG